MDMFAADKERKQEEGEVGASGCKADVKVDIR